jgi:hypothetical protein
MGDSGWWLVGKYGVWGLVVGGVATISSVSQLI